MDEKDKAIYARDCFIAYQRKEYLELFHEHIELLEEQKKLLEEQVELQDEHLKLQKAFIRLIELVKPTDMSKIGIAEHEANVAVLDRLIERYGINRSLTNVRDSEIAQMKEKQKK